MIKKYRKKPIVIEAVKFENVEEVLHFLKVWLGKAYLGIQTDMFSAANSITIDTLEGQMTAKPGDYIIKGINGEFYPCKPDIFLKTYEEA